MPDLNDLSGLRFGRLCVLKRDGSDRHGNALWLCLCDCKNEARKTAQFLNRSPLPSCGCYNASSQAAFRRADAVRDKLLGKKFGRLTIVSVSQIKTNADKTVFDCVCDCGNAIQVKLGSLTSNHTSSCGCLALEARTKHGLSEHRLYGILKGMISRCYNPKHTSYRNYGAIGVSICDDWRYNFESFYDWAISNGYKDHLTIDRYPNKAGNYEPSNCRWATPSQQQRNTKSNVLSEVTVEEIRSDPRSNSELAKLYNTTWSHIAAVRQRKIWKT